MDKKEIESLSSMAARLVGEAASPDYPSAFLREGLELVGGSSAALFLTGEEDARCCRDRAGNEIGPFGKQLLRDAAPVTAVQADCDGSLALIPIQGVRENLGWLVLRKDVPISEEDLLLLSFFCHFSALAFEYQAQQSGHERQLDMALGLYDLFEETINQVFTDSLTEVKTKAFFYERLDQEFAESRRYAYPLSLLMMDIDFFKGINDSYGHPVGDVVLKRVGEILRQSVRAADTAARFGGEEFAVILPQTSEDGAFIIAERIRRRMEEESFQSAPGFFFHATISVGVSSLKQAMKNPNQVIEDADKALYRAKKSGRNRVSLNSSEPFTVESAARSMLEGEGMLVETAKALSLALETKDPFISKHSRAVAYYAMLFAKELDFSPERQNAFMLAGFMHDVGMIAVPDDILKRLPHLSVEDAKIFQNHPSIALNLLNRFQGFNPIRDAVLYHHEQYDGSGYPEGLSGEQIPLAARILAICDGYDSMVFERKENRSTNAYEVKKALRSQAGKRYDPALVEDFIKADLPVPDQLPSL
ncbi:MAG TPA: diguanylate cyclase [Chroococcales cyanobacterium]|jgi:diguanylate cyclase (GGDEF)-like protein